MWHRAVRQHCDLLTIKTRWLNATRHCKLYNHEGFPSDSYVHAFPGTRTRPHSFNPPKTTASKQAILLWSLLSDKSQRLFVSMERKGRKSLNIRVGRQQILLLCHSQVPIQPSSASIHICPWFPPRKQSLRTEDLAHYHWRPIKYLGKGMVKYWLQVMSFFFCFKFNRLIVLQRQKQTFLGKCFHWKSSTGSAFFSTTAARVEEGEEKHALGFLSFRFLRRNSPMQQFWLWRKHLWLWPC